MATPKNSHPKLSQEKVHMDSYFLMKLISAWPQAVILL